MVTDEKILSLISDAEGPAVWPAEIAEDLPISRPGVYKRMEDLVERDLLASKKWNQSKVYWITDEGREFLEDVD